MREINTESFFASKKKKQLGESSNKKNHFKPLAPKDFIKTILPLTFPKKERTLSASFSTDKKRKPLLI